MYEILCTMVFVFCKILSNIQIVCIFTNQFTLQSIKYEQYVQITAVIPFNKLQMISRNAHPVLYYYIIIVVVGEYSI